MISLSLNSVVSMDNYLKILLLAINNHMEDEPLDAQALKDARVWFAGAKPFVTEFGINATKFTKVFQSLGTKDHAKGYEVLDTLVESSSDKILKKIVSDMDVPKVKLTMLQTLYKAITTEEQGTLDKALKSIMYLGDPRISRLFVDADVQFDQRSHVNELEAFSKKIFKKPVKDLTVEDKNALRERDPDAYKKFLKLNLAIGKVRKEAVETYVRASGKLTVPISELKRYLKKQDIQNTLPDFKGFMDEKEKLYNELNVRINGTITGRIEMNPAYDAKKDNTYIFQHFPLFGNGGPQRVYTVNHKTAGSNHKFEVVDKLADKIAKIRKRWLKDMRGSLSDSTTLAALIIELIYITSGRIGSKTGASGISALMVKEFSDKASGHFTLTYLGKKGVKQQHKVKTSNKDTKLILSMLQDLSKGKKPKDWLIANSKGNVLSSGFINKYLLSIGAPAGTTVHKFRHVRGTAIAKQVMADSPFKPNGKTKLKDAAVNKWFKEAMKKVGKELGHISGDNVTATTALKNYIDPRAVEEWFKSLGVRPATDVQAIIDSMKKDKD